jgi:hypothetical protein
MPIVCVSRRAASIIAVLTTGSIGSDCPILPTQLVDENTSVEVSISTSFGATRLVARSISGVLSLRDQKDLESVRGRVVFPLDRISCGSPSTDSRLRQLCESKAHPRIRYTILGLQGLKHLSLLGLDEEVPVVVDGVLTIRAVSQIVPLKGTIRRTQFTYEFLGDAIFDWREFGIKKSWTAWWVRAKPTVRSSVRVSLPCPP